MTPDPDARLEQSGFSVGVRSLEDRLGIKADSLCVRGQLVRQSDVDVPVHHTGELRELGRLERANIDHRSLEVGLVKGGGSRRGLVVESADDFRILG